MREDDQSYFEEPEFKESLKKYESALRNGSPIYMDADELTDIAEYYMIRHQESRANDAISLAVQLHPQSVDPQIFLARQEMFHDRLEQAHRICDAIADQDDREVVFLNAELLIREQKVPEACNFMEAAYQKLDSQRTLFLYDCACILMDYTLWEEARIWTERVLQQQPQHQGALMLKAEIQVMTNQNEAAIEILNNILDQDPYRTPTWNLLAEAQGNLERYHEAMDSAEYVLAIDEENSHAMLIKANCQFHLNNLEEAHAMYQAFLQKNTDDDVVCYLDAVCLTHLNRYTEAAEMLHRANEIGGGLSREQFNIYMQQAHVESHLHHLSQAIEALQNAQEVVPDNTPFEYELLLAHVFLENGCYAEAEQYFKLALDASADKRETMLMIGVAFAESERYREAREIFTTLLQLFGDNEACSVKPYLAYCCYQTHDQEGFLRYLRDAVSVSKETTEYLFSSVFPNVAPEDYYLYAFKSVHGHYPQEGE